ncbi:hypothetical protein DEO23_15625 [Brachybacterium endophyticum]|uniref:Uncharacterized protein n=1 Tax=Brachybacterium endophyticum TaxID=2182385 RepID=A0A2U2RGL1_9MICO|nr:hypothetical protein [Brachybacterium endophyticum]PWH04961.1 hypothetical protein DEO23_15625 [Brachybacterium endophyticum]
MSRGDETSSPLALRLLAIAITYATAFTAGYWLLAGADAHGGITLWVAGGVGTGIGLLICAPMLLTDLLSAIRHRSRTIPTPDDVKTERTQP